ncbi:hypothetical protein MUP00_12305 [Candidatus Bathyarchaeota archaeon]|nr:hypothetical protein [Candidatus Bathyarchaeota archaeon]
MDKTGLDEAREKRDREREEAVDLLRRQLAVEGELVRLYEETEAEIESSAVRHLLHMIQLDSMKHIDICQVAIDVLKGEEVMKKEREEIVGGLQCHIALEEESLERAKKLSGNTLVQDTAGIYALIGKWMKDEKDHHEMLKRLAEKTFFRVSDDPLALMFKGTDDLEDRQRRFSGSRKPGKKEEPATSEHI